MTNQKHYVTKDGLEKIKIELDDLKMNKRPETVLRIESAKELGDLSENAEYQTAKEDLAFIDGRINQLVETLNDAVIIEKDHSNDMINIGSGFVAKGSDKEIKYRIVGSNEADPTQGMISNESPIGQAFLGKKVGDDVEVKTPNGAMHYKIISIE